MEWFEEVKSKQKRKNKVLFSKESSCFAGIELASNPAKPQGSCFVGNGACFSGSTGFDQSLSRRPAPRTDDKAVQSVVRGEDQNAAGKTDNPAGACDGEGAEQPGRDRFVSCSSTGMFGDSYARTCAGVSHL